MSPPRGLNFYVVIQMKIIKKSSSQELLYQMGQYLAWSIPRMRRYKFVQIKVPGITNSHTLRGIVLYRFI